MLPEARPIPRYTPTRLAVPLLSVKDMLPSLVLHVCANFTGAAECWSCGRTDAALAKRSDDKTSFEHKANKDRLVWKAVNISTRAKRDEQPSSRVTRAARSLLTDYGVTLSTSTWPEPIKTPSEVT